MQEYQMENLIRTLIRHLKNRDELNENIFYEYMRHVCNAESPYYMLGDLELLAKVLKKYEILNFIDLIEPFDKHAAMQLDILVMEHE
ncbi:hypothetical protein ACRBU7_03975 [Priestia aryabhattai]|uniref:hypothetical protein n=1 Tax=Priestia aryabhattai TaxID=412384 RepID=UPI003D7FD297